MTARSGIRVALFRFSADLPRVMRRSEHRRGADSRTESRKSPEGMCRIRSSDRSRAPSWHDSHLDVRSQWNESRGRHEHTQNDTYPFLHARAALRAAPAADHYGRAQGAHPRRPGLANHGHSAACRPIAAARQANSPLRVRAKLRNGRSRNWPPASSNVRVTACSKSALCPWWSCAPRYFRLAQRQLIVAMVSPGSAVNTAVG